MKRKILPACTFLCIASALHAAGQSTLNATGGSAFIGGAEFEWSVGEMALVNTFTTSTIVVTQGVLQTGLRDATLVPDLSAGAHLRVYPNPANNIVNVAYDATASGSLTLRLSDLAGRILLERKDLTKTGANTATIDMSALAAATYLLQVTITNENGTNTLPYKIQKLQ